MQLLQSCCVGGNMLTCKHLLGQATVWLHFTATPQTRPPQAVTRSLFGPGKLRQVP